MKEQVRKLVELQAVDSQIHILKKESEEKPKQINNLQQLFDKKKQKIVDLEEGFKKIQLKRKEKEGDLATKEENIKKLQIQLYQLKTNKEYQAMLTEIAGHKADNSLLEEEIIKILDEMDSLKIELEKAKEQLIEEEKKINQEKKTVGDRITEINEELKQLEFKRSQITPIIQQRILAQYERVLKNRDGLALVAVKNDTCQGCFLSLPPQVINEIKMNDRVVVCEVCSRILYLEEEL